MFATSIFLLLGAAALVAVLHSILPDHWVPLAVVARTQRWSLSRVMRVTFLASLGHVLASLVLGGIIALIGLQFQKQIDMQQGYIVGAVLILTGICFLIWGLVGRGPHGHSHTDGHGHSHKYLFGRTHAHNTDHDHTHAHTDAHEHVHADIHDHDHTDAHAHSHADIHDHDHEHDHILAYSAIRAHAHEHEHAQSEAHTHDHAYAQSAIHVHADTHEHDHDHNDGHTHAQSAIHDHTHDDSHDHNHDHAHNDSHVHNQDHSHDQSAKKEQSLARRLAAIAVPFGVAASPDLTILPVALAASAISAIAVVSVLSMFALLTIVTFVGLTLVATLLGYQIKGDWLERHATTITSIVLIAIGIVAVVGF